MKRERRTEKWARTPTPDEITSQLSCAQIIRPNMTIHRPRYDLGTRHAQGGHAISSVVQSLNRRASLGSES